MLSKEKGNAAVTAELRKNTLLQNLLDEIKQKLNISAENSTFDFDLSNVSGLFSKVNIYSCIYEFSQLLQTLFLQTSLSDLTTSINVLGWQPSC